MVEIYVVFYHKTWINSFNVDKYGKSLDTPIW